MTCQPTRHSHHVWDLSRAEVQSEMDGVDCSGQPQVLGQLTINGGDVTGSVRPSFCRRAPHG